MRKLILFSAISLAVGTVAHSGIAVAQRLDFVPVNGTGRLDALSNQSAVYAAADRAAMNGTSFAVISVSGGFRAMRTTPLSTLRTVNAADLAPRAINPSMSPVDTVGLEALPTAHTPLVALARDQRIPGSFNITFPGAAPPRDGYAISATGIMETTPELGCDRLGNNCGVVYNTPNGVYTLRFPLAMGIMPAFSALVPPSNTPPDRWDIAYDDVSAVIGIESTIPAEIRVRSLAPSLNPTEAVPRVIDGALSNTFPRIACALGVGVGCITVMNNNGLLQSKLSGARVLGQLSRVHDGTGRANMLIREAYDIALGPIGYRVAYFAFVGVTLKLRVVDISADGTYVGVVQDTPAGDGPGPPRSVRIAAAVNPDYSLVTWINGTGVDAVNSAMVVRPAPAIPDGGMEGGVDPGPEAGMEAGMEAGIEPILEAGMEGGVAMQEAGWDHDVPVVASEVSNEQDGATQVDPRPLGYQYYGGACQCRTSPTQPTQPTSPTAPWQPAILTAGLVGLLSRARTRSGLAR